MVQITGGRLGCYATGTVEVCGWCRSQVEVLVTVQLVPCCRVCNGSPDTSVNTREV